MRAKLAPMEYSEFVLTVDELHALSQLMAEHPAAMKALELSRMGTAGEGSTLMARWWGSPGGPGSGGQVGRRAVIFDGKTLAVRGPGLEDA